jgi:phosphoglycolate phosphatase
MAIVKAVIFDVDGVLLDSLEANSTFYKILMNKAGYNPSKDDIRECFHRTLWDSIKYLSEGADKKEVQRIWDLAQSEKIDTRKLLKFPPQLARTLSMLNKSYALAIATNRIKPGIEEILEGAEVKDFFDAIIAFGDYKKPKPHPEPLLLAAKAVGIKPSEAVYIGDSVTDIDAALAAGMKSIHLSSQKHDDANVGIKFFKEIPKAILEL